MLRIQRSTWLKSQAGTSGIVLGVEDSRPGSDTREGSEGEDTASDGTVIKRSFEKGKLSFLWSLLRFGM
jgi:hypothetical protein